MSSSWLYDFTISLYALSILGYFIDFLDNNRRVNQLAFWLLSLVWILQSVLFVLKMKMMGEFPIITPSEGFFFYAWILVTLSLVMHRLLRVDFFVFFTNLIGFIMMAISLFKVAGSTKTTLSLHLVSEVLVIHIVMAFLAYGAFTISFIFSMMYLIEYQMLKKKQWSKRLVRFGSLEKIDQLAFLCNIIGVLFLSLSLILGMARAYAVIPHFSWHDPKVLLSFIVIGSYSFYLYERVGKNVYGKPLIYWNSIAFLLLLTNIFVSRMLTSFHFWG